MPGFRIEQDPLPMICVKRDLRHIQPEVTSFALVRQTAQGFRCAPSLLPEMSAEPDREEIPSRGAFRHMEFPRDDGGISHLLVIEHPVGGPAFRLSAGPVRQQDHPPERFRPRHIVLFPGSGILFRLAEDLIHSDALIRSDFLVVFTHDINRIFHSFYGWVHVQRPHKCVSVDSVVHLYAGTGGERFIMTPFVRVR